MQNYQILYTNTTINTINRKLQGKVAQLPIILLFSSICLCLAYLRIQQ